MIDKTALEAVVDIYATLKLAAESDLPSGFGGVLGQFSIQQILEFIEGYRSDIKYVLKIYDFNKNKENDEVYQTLFTNNGERGKPLVKSFNRIFSSEDTTGNKSFLSEIHLDLKSNYCWSRFAILKEACHVLLMLDREERELEYPYANEASEVRDLLNSIHTLPFSVLDFDTDGYLLGLKIENAAELLAYLLLVGHDRIEEDRKQYLSQSTDDREQFDFYPIADLYKVPRRYTELFVADDRILEKIISDAQKAISNSAFDSVPAPKPIKDEKKDK